MIAVSADRRALEGSTHMKEAIVLFIFALIVSSLVGGLDTSQEPQNWKVGVSDMVDSEFGVQRKENSYGEVNYVNEPQPYLFMTNIDEKSEQWNVQYPLGAN